MKSLFHRPLIPNLLNIAILKSWVPFEQQIVKLSSIFCHIFFGKKMSVYWKFSDVWILTTAQRPPAEIVRSAPKNNKTVLIKKVEVLK